MNSSSCTLSDGDLKKLLSSAILGAQHIDGIMCIGERVKDLEKPLFVVFLYLPEGKKKQRTGMTEHTKLEAR